VEEIDGDITRKINQLRSEINRMEKEIISIQNKCYHKKTKIELKNRSLIKVCATCDKYLGYPSPQETKDSGYI
jgi:septal ring factor EnvC (AmiA/AmiB activator)